MRFLILLSLLIFSCDKVDSNTSKVCVKKVFNDTLMLTQYENGLIYKKNLKSNIESKLKFKISNCNSFNYSRNYIFYIREGYDLVYYDLVLKKEFTFYRSKYIISKYKLHKAFVSIQLNNNRIIIIDIKSKAIIHTFDDETCNSTKMRDVIIDGNYLYLTNFDCRALIKFNLETKKRVWSYGFLKNNFYRIIDNENLIFLGETGNISKNEGRIILLYKNSGAIKFIKNEKFDLITKPVVYNDFVAFKTYDNFIKLINLKNHTIQIISTKQIDISCDFQFLLHNGKLYFKDCSYYLYEYDFLSKRTNKLKKVPKPINSVYNINGKLDFCY